MAKDKPSPDNDPNAIPLLESIVIPGHGPGAPKPKTKKPANTASAPAKPATPAQPPSAPAAPPATAAAVRGPNAAAALDNPDELAALITSLVTDEAQRLVADIEPHLAQEVLPRLITEVLQPEINAVYEEIKTVIHGSENRFEDRLRAQGEALSGRVEALSKQIGALRPLADALKRLQEDSRAFQQRTQDDGRNTQQQLENAKQQIEASQQRIEGAERQIESAQQYLEDARQHMAKLSAEAEAGRTRLEEKIDYLAQEFETKLKLRATTLEAAEERLSGVGDALRQELLERLAPLERTRDQIQRLQNEVAALHKSAAMIHQTDAEVAKLRADIAQLRSEQQNLLSELEERFDKAYLRRLAALPKLMGSILQQNLMQELEESFDRAYLRRLGAIPKLVESLVRARPETRQADVVQSSAHLPTAMPPSAAVSPETEEHMDKTYNPAAIEGRWYETWEKSNYFAPRGDGKPYCIMIPPPNVTGSLHMGHAFQDTIMDALIRYHRMRGERTLWQAGTDHAGIATQMVVERQLAAKGKSRHDLGREAFTKQVWQWKNESGGMITRQLRRLGASLDWSRERFTMDTGLSKAVRDVFVQLYEEGLIYRGKRLVSWDPVLHTALSDLEVISEEEEGSLWHIRYPLAEGNGNHLVVATTRPETLLGDAAVAVHPEDERYQHLVGKFLDLPLTGRRIPVIADEYVDREFGTGCVKITPAHDFNDYQVWQRHKDSPLLRTVPYNGLINIFTIDAKVKHSWRDDESMLHRAPSNGGGPDTSADNAGRTATVHLLPEKYRGLDRFEARKRIVADLESAGLLEKAERHRHMVPRGDRSHAVIEPLLTDQWFVRAAPLAEPAIKAVERGEIRFVPENWTSTYYEWMRNIEDWCISRQIWWGHRIPAWYDRRGNVYVGRSEADVRKKHDLPSIVPLVQDPDVLDTWFSSALWPFSTLGWPEQNDDLARFYPTNVLVTGFDIIFFWVARMIMMGLKFTGKVPFREVYIHGLVRDSEGQKMSKSKGNVLDPIDLIDGIGLEALVQKRTTGLMQPEMAAKIDKATRSHFPEGIPPFGTDALRFTFAALASTGRDIRFDTGRIEGYRNFCNKLWNASRFVMMNCEGKDLGQNAAERSLSLADRWILSRLQVTLQAARDSFASYRFDNLASAIYEFTWNEYCDWYLELAKPVLNGSDQAAARGTRHTLVSILETLLRLAHPLMPFITEEIWQKVGPLAGKKGDTIMLQPFPEPDASQIDRDASAEMGWVMEFVLGIRKIRGEMNINPSKTLPLLLQGGDADDRRRTERNGVFIKTLARLETITWLDDETSAPQSATALVGNLKLLVPMAGLIDKQAEMARLEKEIGRLRKDLASAENKLANPNFVDRAPTDVVTKERQRANELRSAIRQLDEQLTRIETL